MWLKQFERFTAENSRFVRTVYTTKCTNVECCTPVVIKTCNTICLSWESNSFQDSIDAWYRNNRQPMHCQQKTLTGGDCDGHRIASERKKTCAKIHQWYTLKKKLVL
jgi:hypothetical protein